MTLLKLLKMKSELRLLPSYYKKAGLIIILLPFIITLLIKLLNAAFLHSHKEIILIIVPSICILGLLIIALARDKFEDEMTILLRLKAMAFTFIAAVIYVITEPLLDWLWGDAVNLLSSRHLVVTMLISYILFFFFLKKLR